MDGAALVWLILAVAAGAVEIATLSLAFAMVAGGALVAALVAGLTGSAPGSVLAFTASTVLLLWVVRPPLARYAVRSGAAELTGAAALVGRPALVLDEVSDGGGQVKLAGETWTARSLAPQAVFELGSTVFVARIDGATAVVTGVPPGPAGVPDPAARPGGDHPTDRPES